MIEDCVHITVYHIEMIRLWTGYMGSQPELSKNRQVKYESHKTKDEEETGINTAKEKEPHDRQC